MDELKLKLQTTNYKLQKSMGKTKNKMRLNSTTCRFNYVEGREDRVILRSLLNINKPKEKANEIPKVATK